MKKIIYLVVFVIFGLLLAFLVHSILEVWYTNLLIKNFDKYSLGLTWDGWFTVYQVFYFILFAIGGLIGFFQGKFWWQRIYEN